MLAQPTTCPHCGSNNLSHALQVSQSAEVGRIGLTYLKAKIFRGVEQLYADLCQNCGSIVRFYVKDTNHNWLQ